MYAFEHHSILAQKEEQLSTRLAELREESSKTEQVLIEVCGEMTLKNSRSEPVDNYKFVS